MIVDYVYMPPDSKTSYHARNMQLYIDSDAAYLVTPKAKGCIGGLFNLCYHYISHKGNPSTKINVPIHIECQILKHVVTSAAEAETPATFLNCKIAICIKRTLEVLGHQQQIVPLKINNFNGRFV